MNTLKLVFLSIMTTFLITSCSKDANIDIDLEGTEKLEAAAGESLTFSLNLAADEGISDITVYSKGLGLDYNAKRNDTPAQLFIDIAVDVPEDATSDQSYEIEIQVVDALGNNGTEMLVLTIK